MKGQRIMNRINEIHLEMDKLDERIEDTEEELLDYELRYKMLKREIKELYNKKSFVDVKSHNRRT